MDQNVFVASIGASTGSVNWSWSGGGTGIDFGHSLDINASNEIYVLGTYTGTAMFGQQQLVSKGSDDVFILHMDENGAVSRPEPNMTGIGGLTVYPNPSHDRVKIAFDLQQKGEIEATVMNLEGKVVLQKPFGQMVPGAHQLDLDMTGLAPGLYFMRLKAGERLQTVKVVKAAR